MKSMKEKSFFLLLMVLILLASIFSFAYAEDGVVAFEKKEYEILKGKSERIAPVIQGIKGNAKYAYTSEDESIATVTNNGTVKAVSVGNVTVNCVVTIGEQDYNCSYILKVLQPVEKIEVAFKTITVPDGSLIPLSFFTVLPENASNKELEITTSSKKNLVAPKQGVFIQDSATITAASKDGSNVKVSVKVSVPKVAWFRNDTIEIDDPEGAVLSFATSTAHSGMFNIGYGMENKSIASFSEGAAIQSDTVYNDPFDPYMAQFAQVTITPLKQGSTKFVVSVNGKKASVKVVVHRSAVYEQLDYNKATKQSDKNQGLRFMAEGSLLKTEVNEDAISYIIAFNGDESKPIKLVTESEVPTMKDSDSIIVAHGIYLGVEEYTSETGLLLSIPVIQLEKVALSNT